MIRSALLATLLGSLLAAPSFAQGGEGSTVSPWFKDTSKDFGRFLEGETAQGEFKFKNPTGEARSFLGVTRSCTCSSLLIVIGDREYTIENDPLPNTIYEYVSEGNGRRRQKVDSIPVPPNGEGRIDMKIDLRSVKGQKSAQITVTTDEARNNVILLSARAFALEYFEVRPPEIRLEQMRWNESRKFSARITSPIQPLFKINNRIGEMPKGMTVTFREERDEGKSTWIIEGTYGPGVDPSSGGGVLRFLTDIENKVVEVRVIAYVTGPIEIEPNAFVQFGRVKRKEGMKKSVRIVPTDDFELDSSKVEVKGLTVDSKYVKVEAKRPADENVVVVTIEILPNAPRALVRGDIVVHLNHPSAKTQELSFNGFVR